MSKNVIVVSAHPDDETLGAGGTLLRHSKQGDKVIWLIVTNISEDKGFPKDIVQKRQREIEEVASIYQFSDVIKLDYPTATLSTSSLTELIPRIGEIFNQFKPEIVYTVNRWDAHSDHKICFDAVMACTKSFRYPYIRQVLSYECISETEFSASLSHHAFQANCFIDITSEIDEKIKIMNIYESELNVHPFPRSERNIRSLATFRGAIAGVEYAEAFQVLKTIQIEKLF